MFVRQHSLLIRFLAVLTLAAWMGASHHDAWLDLVGQDHHHDHHTAADHHDHSHHGHSHSGDSEHDHRDSIPLPDTHTDPVSPSLAKIGVDGPKQISDAGSWVLLAVGILIPGSSDTECEHPPPLEVSDIESPALIHLAHSVQSNAPPSFS